MNKQYIDMVQKWEKAFLMKKSKIATWLYCSMAEYETRLSYSKNSGKRRWEQLSDCQVNTDEALNGHTHSLKKIIIYCLPTKLF